MSLRWKFYHLFLVLMFLLNPDVHANAGLPRTIRSIRILADGDVDRAMVSSLLKIKPGDLYSIKNVEDGIVRLAEVGRFKKVDSVYTPESGELSINLAVIETLAGIDVSSLSSQDLEALKSDVIEVVGVSAGDPIYVDLFDEIRARILSRLFDRGYLAAKVALALEQKDRSASRRLLVTLDLGTRSKIRKFKLNGFSMADGKEFFKILRTQNEIEQFVDSLKVEQALNLGKKAITHSIGRRSVYVKRNFEILANLPLDWISLSNSVGKWASIARQDGFYDFSVKLTSESVDSSGELVDVVVTLDRGVRYNIQIKNNVVFWERQLRRLVVDRTLRLGVPFSVSEAEIIIRRKYESAGYKDIKVETRLDDLQGERKITFLIREGKQYFLRNVSISGVSDTEAADLNGVTRDWLKPIESPFHPVYFDEPLLKSRASEMLRLIRKKGYLQARILEIRFFQDPNRSRMDMQFSIQPGPKLTVGNVVVTGNKVLTEAELERLVAFEPGTSVDPTKLEEISQNLVRKYQELGFPNVRIFDDEKLVFKVPPGSNEVDIEIGIDTGPQILVGKIYVQGLKKVQKEVVLRELNDVGIRSKRIWKVDAINRAEQRLLSLGIFGSSRFESSGGRLLERPQDESAVEKQERDLRVDVSERNAGAFEFGPGYRTDLGLVGFAEFNYRNLSGLNRALILRAQISRKIEDFVDYEQKYSATLLEPYIFKDPTRVRLSLNYSLEDQYVFESGERTNGFLKSEFSLGVGAEREIFDNFRVTHNIFTFSLPRIIDPIGTDNEVDTDKSYRIGTMGTILTYDTRDNFFNPTTGVLTQLNVEYSAPWIASDQNAHFIITRFNFSDYFPVTTGLVFATSLALARVYGLGETSGIPENKRLILGGLSSIRSINEGGLLSEPGALVREQSFEGKFELRQTLFYDFGFAYFFDVGRIWALRYLGGQSPSDTGWRSGLGFGLRYNTMVGPLSADFVYNPDPKEGLGNEAFKFQLSIGTF